jgi:hypothetical protein
MLLDEVDLILHPLKSELNFPIGDKFDLDCSDDGERWGLPIHLLDALFFCSTGKVSSFDQKGTALEILKKFATVIQQGIAERNLQRLPHGNNLNNRLCLFSRANFTYELRSNAFEFGLLSLVD